MARGETTGYSGFCRNRNLPADAPHVVRFLIPEAQSVTFEDAIRGPITWDPVILRDTVILKTDGYPTYHLGATVDDHDMRISHILRGEEWISTSPLHYLIYRALAYAIDPEWTKGHRFSVAYEIQGEGGGRWVVSVNETSWSFAFLHGGSGWY